MFGPEDAAGLAVFRLLFGAVMVWDAYRYLAAGWVRSFYVEPEMLFKYVGFEWVHPLPLPGMYAVFVLMLLSALGIAVGWKYRSCAIAFFFIHTYVFLLDAAHYLNHAYLISLLAYLMIFLPADRALSVDAWRRPSWARREIPRWPRVLLLAQLGIVYTYGGIAKINRDWLLREMPIRRWMQNAAERVPLGGEILTTEWFIHLVIWGGLLFDLLIVPALLWRRTRKVAVVLAVSFHLTNAYMFNIGPFPWFMLAATTLFLSPDWPRRTPGWGARIARQLDSAQPMQPVGSRIRSMVLVGMALWLGIQILIPLRHHLYPGDVAWNEEGHLGAWRMKLRSKRGQVRFRVLDPESGRSWMVDPSEHLTSYQARKMGGRPELIRQYAHFLAERYRTHEGVEVEVNADAWVSLNYRRRRRFVDPRVDLAREPARLGPYTWVLPEGPDPSGER